MDMKIIEKVKGYRKKYIIGAGALTLRLLFILLFILVVVMFSTSDIKPLPNQENVDTRFYVRDININGHKLYNTHLSHPFFLYMESTYLPVTKGVGEIMGFLYLYHEDGDGILISKIEPEREGLSEDILKNEGDNPKVHVRYDMKVYVTSDIKKKDDVYYILGEPATRKADFDKDEASKLDMLGFPVLEDEEGVLYLPVKVFMESDIFKWDVISERNLGLLISTVEDVLASSFIDEEEMKFNEGLSAYIRSRNPDIGLNKSQEYTFYFKNASMENNIPVERLMAISQCESRFRNDIESRAGALGMMQILVKTGEGYGLSREDLLNPQKNISFGAKYYAQLMDGYKGDEIRALSAYQMGIPKENLGDYTPSYANTILWAEKTLNTFLVKNGYI